MESVGGLTRQRDVLVEALIVRLSSLLGTMAIVSKLTCTAGESGWGVIFSTHSGEGSQVQAFKWHPINLHVSYVIQMSGIVLELDKEFTCLTGQTKEKKRPGDTTRVCVCGSHGHCRLKMLHL